MSGSIFLKNNVVLVSNKSFYNLLDWAVSIAKEIEHSRSEEFIKAFEEKNRHKWTPCTSLDIQEEFTADEADFWSLVFKEIAEKVFRRELGNTSDLTWQSGFIHAAWKIHEMLHDYAKSS
ncbi:MAG TPA: hypothetical protein VE954_08950 [Oligoflexus sp.]|uniref:hypothetical protein n=1 Tax=Oligoflexus sp. TaxID=1971216 RepID=UPI002D72FBA5|nr:hypothetical protein [Oligoflexus sp.]HYX33230.1 hypothetical protein [Oligoflexus sp.]